MSSCTLCSKGRFGPIQGAKSARDGCSPCWPGTFANEDGSSGCDFCPAGTYNSYVASSFCTLCPLGRYSLSIAADGLSSCLACPADTHGGNGSQGQVYL